MVHLKLCSTIREYIFIIIIKHYALINYKETRSYYHIIIIVLWYELINTPSSAAASRCNTGSHTRALGSSLIHNRK